MRICGSTGSDTLTSPVILQTPATFSEGVELLVKTALDISQGQQITAVAGGIAGPLDTDKNTIGNAPNLPGWQNKKLRSSLEEKLQANVLLENDASLAGLGEAVFGSGKGSKIVAYLTVSTGVGGTYVVDGHLPAGSRGFEPGHQIVNPDGPVCPGCKVRGHLEAYLGGASLRQRFGKKPEAITDQSVWDEAAFILAIGLNNTAVYWTPDCIVLGGPIIEKMNLEKVQEHLKELLQIYPHTPRIVKARLGEMSGLYGALSLLSR